MLEVSETRRLRQLEEENGRLKKIASERHYSTYCRGFCSATPRMSIGIRPRSRSEKLASMESKMNRHC
jgi:hypothetical protein